MKRDEKERKSRKHKRECRGEEERKCQETKRRPIGKNEDARTKKKIAEKARIMYQRTRREMTNESSKRKC